MTLITESSNLKQLLNLSGLYVGGNRAYRLLEHTIKIHMDVKTTIKLNSQQVYPEKVGRMCCH